MSRIALFLLLSAIACGPAPRDRDDDDEGGSTTKRDGGSPADAGEDVDPASIDPGDVHGTVLGSTFEVKYAVAKDRALPDGGSGVIVTLWGEVHAELLPMGGACWFPGSRRPEGTEDCEVWFTVEKSVGTHAIVPDPDEGLFGEHPSGSTCYESLGQRMHFLKTGSVTIDAFPEGESPYVRGSVSIDEENVAISGAFNGWWCPEE